MSEFVLHRVPTAHHQRLSRAPPRRFYFLARAVRSREVSLLRLAGASCAHPRRWFGRVFRRRRARVHRSGGHGLSPLLDDGEHASQRGRCDPPSIGIHTKGLLCQAAAADVRLYTDLQPEGGAREVARILLRPREKRGPLTTRPVAQPTPLSASRPPLPNLSRSLPLPRTDQGRDVSDLLQQEEVRHRRRRGAPRARHLCARRPRGSLHHRGGRTGRL